METYKENIKDIWLKAAVLGSLWASFEIIMGSFFHNIRLPMAGTILTVVGVSLMIAFGQMWKEKGLFWRAGLICALMKSVSPSAVLLGPMIGIFAEALVLELTLFIFGRNLFGYILAGIMALYSVVIHKVITLLFLYGFNIVKILENLYYFTIKQLKVENLDFYQAFFILSSLYLFLGIFASLSGYFIGKKVISIKNNTKKDSKIKLDFSNKYLDTNKQTHKYSVFLLFFHFAVIVISMALVNFISLYFSAGLIAIYVTFCVIYYKRALRHLTRPMVWIQVVLLTIVSSIFYNGFQTGNIFQISGIIVGLEMSLRATLLMIGFSAISSELRNPFVKVILYRKGFRQLYKAIGLAFSALPHIIKNAAKPKIFFKQPFIALTNNMLIADDLLQKFTDTHKNRTVFIVTGEKHSGKTTYIQNVVECLNNNNIKHGGFIAEGEFENNQRSKFTLKNLTNNEQHIICSTTPTDNDLKVGRFYFSKEGIEFGENILQPENLSDNKIVFIDEVGPFELKGKGWSNSIEKLLENPDILQIWTVRESLKYEVLKRFDITNALIFDISKDNTKNACDKIREF